MFAAKPYRAAVLGAIVLSSALFAEPVQRPGGLAAQAGLRMPEELQADFQKRVGAYADLHKKLEATLPKLPKDATPQQVDRDQRAIAQLVVQARADAKQGDLFIPGMQTYVRALLAEVFKGPAGAEARKQVHDEPHPVRPVVNKRYPDEVPLSTMPPLVLASLPQLPAELEYRFVNNDLILMDVHAHIILDYVANAMPAAPAATPTP
ncbi:MAG TPA: hypothetical protein VIP80_16245 [Gemmatimonadales bacterium]|jgi:hypothetical protein